MNVPFTWEVTGWFMIGWTPEFRVGEVRPLAVLQHAVAVGDHHDHRRTAAGMEVAVNPSIDGRKAFVSATMTDFEGTVRSDATGLMIRLLPHQP